MELIYQIILTVLILGIAFILGRLVQRGHAKLLKKGSLSKLIVQRTSRILIYFICLGIIYFLWQSEILQVSALLESINSILPRVIMIIIVWGAAIYIVRNIIGVIRELEYDPKLEKFNQEVSVLTQKVFKYSIYAVAVIWSLSIFGLTGSIEGLLVGAGFAGIVIGFAAQQTLANLLAGISLLLDRPYKIGDWINLTNSKVVGSVKEISLRSTTINAPDNTPVNIPNAIVAGQPIINYSVHKMRRLFLNVGISYESDVGKAIKVITETLEKDVAKADKGIPGQGYYAPIEVIVDSFADSSVNLQAKVFIDTREGEGLFKTKSRMLDNIKKNLTKAGVEIPYPRQYVIFDKDQKKK